MTKKKPQLVIGPLSRKNTSSHFYMPPANFSAPSRITNASSTLPLVLKPAPVRPGSEDFLRCPSKGTR